MSQLNYLIKILIHLFDYRMNMLQSKTSLAVADIIIFLVVTVRFHNIVVDI